ncbi:hypothetical protein HMPREF3159_09300 [Brachybacterium sp. HMSC06H03]|nr:hypothetical protein HMPREF3159_09300 [Brachybacterium sp. HMSC06H03]
MSPRTMFHRLGSSSRLVARMKRPKGTIRSASSRADLGPGSRIERNFHRVKILPPCVMRSWAKSTGRPIVTSTPRATSAMGIAATTSAPSARTTSALRRSRR